MYHLAWESFGIPQEELAFQENVWLLRILKINGWADAFLRLTGFFVGSSLLSVISGCWYDIVLIVLNTS